MADDSKLRAFPTDTRPHNAGAERDPLAELARLIGQDDVFEQMRRDAERAGRRGPSRAAAIESQVAASHAESYSSAPRDLRGSHDPNTLEAAGPRERLHRGEADPYSGQAAREYRRAASHPPAAYQQHEAADQAYPGNYASQPEYALHTGEVDPYHAAAAGGYDESSYDPAYPSDEPDYLEEAPALEKRRSGLALVGVVLGIAVVGTAGAFGYRAISGGSESGQPPVIKANSAPSKVAPVQQAREQTGSRTTYDRIDKGQPDKVVSREEQPVELREAKISPRMTGVGGASGVVAGITGQTPAALTAPSPGLANPNEPKKVKTIAIRPDGSVVPDSVTRARANESAARLASAAPTSSGRTGATRAPNQGPMAIMPQGADADALRAPATPPTRTASIPTGPAVAPEVAGSHVVQVASQKSEEDAHASFRTLQAKYPTVLGARQPLIRRIDLGERGVFYRVQVGPFASADQANDLCGDLKAAGGQCIVQRN